LFPFIKWWIPAQAEFEALTPYYYSTYEQVESEVLPSDKRKVMILVVDSIASARG
jgi:carbamoyl-phosphate synthase large subunit